jgi:hypothetical protein
MDRTDASPSRGFPIPVDTDGVAMCVLASGSGGNCSVVCLQRGLVRRLVLVDLGLSPRRTFKLLCGLGFGPHPQQLIDDVLVTHLDHDHFHAGWLSARSGLPGHARLRMHERHAWHLRHAGLADERLVTFDASGPFRLDAGVHCHPILMAHDDEGASALRLDFAGLGGGSLGYATDLGRVTDALVEHMAGERSVCSGQCGGAAPACPASAGCSRPLAGVNVLAIESNYCPRMQVESSRPWYLKQRIMGGRGHLSNEQCMEAVRAIAPSDHVVLLHLSRQCNRPEAASSAHAGAGYGLTVTSQHEATAWVRVSPRERPAARRVVVKPVRGAAKAAAGCGTVSLFAGM